MLKHHDNKERYRINNKVSKKKAFENFTLISFVSLKFLVFSIWVGIFAAIAALVFTQDEVVFNHNILRTSLYIPLQRPIWGIFLSWVAYACLTDNAGNVVDTQPE